MPATSGDPNLKNYVPRHNAIAVQRLIDAGAIVFGKTNVPYHAMDFQSYDVLLAPVSPTAAFPHNHSKPMASRTLTVNGRSKSYWNNLTWTVMAIVSGLPATVAPVGRTESGLPVGVQIIGDRFEDRTTIDFARGLSEIIGGFVAPPGYKK
jgi:amidase